MNKADNYMVRDIKNILENGYMDINPRPRYKDGTKAHTKSVNHVFRTYDLSKGEFPICSLRPIAWKTGIKETFAIYQNQSNKISEFERLGCGWWGDWMLEDGTIGRSYPYNLESHRPNEMTKKEIEVKKRFVDSKYKELDPSIEEERIVFGVGYLGNVESVKNFEEWELIILKKMWIDMIEECYGKNFKSNEDKFVHNRWHNLENFLRDVRHIPQYFLAREDKFENWRLSKDYYVSNAYSKETCVFLPIEEHGSYRVKDILCKKDYDFAKRYELSRNQLVFLLEDLVKNPYGRRHVISFWHWANIDKKALVECAYETIWNVRNDGNGTEYLDMCLVQRSGDMLMASGAGAINEAQYASLLMMVAQHCGYKVGVFSHIVMNEQIYDRFYEAADEMLHRYENNHIDKQPTLVLNPNKTDFFDFTIEDFTMLDYTPITPQIVLPIAV